MNELFLSNVIKGVTAGTQEAIRQALLFNTKLAIWKNREVLEITPDEAEAMMDEHKDKKEIL